MLPVRPNTTEVCVRRDSQAEIMDAVDNMIQTLVELVKRLIDDARQENCVGIQDSARRIHENAENTVTLLLKLVFEFSHTFFFASGDLHNVNTFKANAVVFNFSI